MNQFHPEERLQIIWAVIVIILLGILSGVFYLYGRLEPTVVKVGLITFLFTCCGLAIGYHVGNKGFVPTILSEEDYLEVLPIDPSPIEIHNPTTDATTRSQPFFGLCDYDGSPIEMVLA